MFKKLQLLIPIPGFLCTPIGKTSFLPQLSQVTKPRGVWKAAFLKTWDMVNNINYKPTFLTKAVFQAIRRMLSFKKVDIVLPQASSGEIAWPPSLTRELETMLGPSLSKDRTRLEFKPREKPRNWERDTMSPLMRLPGHIRRTIILYVVGVDSIVYPTDTLAGLPSPPPAACLHGV